MIKTSEAAAAGVAPEVAQEQDPPNVRLLKYVVVALGVLLIGCFVAVFVIIGYRLANPSAKTVQTHAYPTKKVACMTHGYRRRRLACTITEIRGMLDGSIIATVITCQDTRNTTRATNQERWL